MNRIVPTVHRQWDPLPIRPNAEDVGRIVDRFHENEELVVEAVDVMLMDGPLQGVEIDRSTGLLTPSTYDNEGMDDHNDKTNTELVIFGNTREEHLSACRREASVLLRVCLSTANRAGARKTLEDAVKLTVDSDTVRLPLTSSATTPTSMTFPRMLLWT